MEREVEDADGVFSRKLSSNWAELPTTLRRRQKHRPEILSQFTDQHSESLDNEPRRMEPKPFDYYPRGYVKRNGMSRRFEVNDVRREEETRKDKKNERKMIEERFNRVEDDYRKHYENYDSKVSQHKSNFRSYASRFDRDFRSVSDDERKTNSPDSLLVKSSESESSSDEYGHTDDSGAFLEKSPPPFDKVPRPKYDSLTVSDTSCQSRFSRFFSKDEGCRKRSEARPPVLVQEQGLLEVDKNLQRPQNSKMMSQSNGHQPASTQGVGQSTRMNNSSKVKTVNKDLLQQRFEYENIPRIDVTKLEQKSFLNPLSQIHGSSKNPAVSRTNGKQPSLDQLRLEEGCLLQTTRNNNVVINNNNNNNNDNGTADNNVSRKTSRLNYPPPEVEHKLEYRATSPPSENQSSIEELQLEGLIKDFYNSEQLANAKSNGDRKLSKMETIAEENADGSKLSVREILKRFEELRTQNELQSEDKVNNDKTLSTIQETLRKLDEKVKSYQIDKKPTQKAILHQENHVSQITKSIQSQASHVNAHQVVHGVPGIQLNNHSHNHIVPNHISNHSVSTNHVNHVNHVNHQNNHQKNHNQSQEWRQHEENTGRIQEESIYESGPVVNDGKHSLLQYAMLNFRQSTEKFEMLKTADGSISGSLKVIESLKNKKKNKKSKGQQDGAEWTWKEQVDLVKYSPVPIEQSLLRLEPELSALAVECFLCLMRYMGDQPLPPDMSEVKCVYTILMHCHKLEPLRDEVCCQLMKQTTNNKSPNPDSCQRGWRLFSIVAAYFTCSEGLRPYLIKYLETAAYDKRRAFHGTATVCLQNLRKTVKYGGRKNVPSVEEIMAISAGRNAKRQIYRLPGGTERVINTKCTTVVQDVIEEMCSVISVRNPHEMDEFSLYCIVDGDAFTMPLARDEYILDVTTELHKNHQVFYLIFCRSVWYYPLRLDAALYIEVVFNQIAPDYLEGLLLVIPGDHLPQEIVYDMAQNAALLHKAADMTHEPTTKEIKYLLPKPVLSLREPRPQQWGNMVQQAWNNVQHNTAAGCKAQVLEILSKWPLFGSSFFAVKRVTEGKEKGGDHILALNRHGVHFVDLVTHETLYHYPYSEVISTRKVKSEEGTLYLDMKCGNLMQQRITRLQTEQAHEISRLIRQYITMEQRMTNAQGASVGFGPR